MTDTPAAYDGRYADWKSWGDANFGRLTADDKAYFDGQMKKAGIQLPAGARVLEIGFGNGSFLAYARQRGWTITGTELSAPLFEAAAQGGYDVHLTGDLQPFAADSFDAVFAFDVVEHVDGDALIGFFAEVKRVAKPGAPFVLRVPNGDSPFGLINQNGDVTHVSAIGRHKINYVAAACQAEQIYYGGEYVAFRNSSPRVTLMRILGAPVRRAMNFLIQCTMFPEMRIAFYARNTVYALRMK